MPPIHKMSSATPLSEFEIFAVPPTQATIENDILSEHRPTSSLDSKSFIEFTLSSGVDEYIRLDKSWFYIRMKISISKPMNAKVSVNDWKNVWPVNNLLNSLFKQIDLVIGDRTVTLAHQTYPYKTDFEIKLGKNNEAKKSYLTAGLWYEDEPGKQLEANIIRSNFISPDKSDKSDDQKNGKEFDLMGKLYLPLFEQNKALIGGCNLRLKFICNDPSFYMICSSDVRVSNVEFTDASLFIHRSKISRPVLEGQLKGLEISNAKYQTRESFVVPITINKGIQDTIIDNVHNGQLPRRAFVAFVNHSAFNGAFNLNPFNYEHFNINHLSFYLNGIQYPEKAFTPDFDRGLYIREFLSLFESTNQDSCDSCINIDRLSYPQGNTIFAVNFAPDLSSGCGSTGYVNPIKFGSMRLQVRFKEPLKEAITVLVYLDYDTLLEINQERNPIYEFN